MVIVLDDLAVLLILVVLLLLSGLARVLVVLIALHATQSVTLLELLGHSAVRVNRASRRNRVVCVDTALRQDVRVLAVEKVRMLLVQRGCTGYVRERTLVVMLQTLFDLPSSTIVVVIVSL